MLVDVHSHIYRVDDSIVERMVQRSKEAEVYIINCCHDCSNPYDVDRTINISKRFDNVFSSFGFYYFSGDRFANLKLLVNEDTLRRSIETIEDLAKKEDKVVAIGEVGLNYMKATSEPEQQKQKEILERFVALSDEVDLPLIVHTSGNAVGDAIRILKEKERPAVLHGFQGSLEQAKEAISFGCLIAIWPTITYSKYLQKLVKNLPLDAIAFETDSPTVSPSNAPLGSLAHHVPIPGIASTEPVHITITAKEVAKIKDIALAEVEQVTTESAKELFHLTI